VPYKHHYRVIHMSCVWPKISLHAAPSFIPLSHAPQCCYRSTGSLLGGVVSCHGGSSQNVACERVWGS